MTLTEAKQIFAKGMQLAREHKLTPRSKKLLQRASQIIRTHAKPARNKKPTQTISASHADVFIHNRKRGKKTNPALPHGAVRIYGRCLRIEAVKLHAHTYGGKPTKPGQHYFHDFTTKNAKIYGLADGSLLIKA